MKKSLTLILLLILTQALYTSCVSVERKISSTGCNSSSESETRWQGSQSCEDTKSGSISCVSRMDERRGNGFVANNCQGRAESSTTSSFKSRLDFKSH